MSEGMAREALATASAKSPDSWPARCPL